MHLGIMQDVQLAAALSELPVRERLLFTELAATRQQVDRLISLMAAVIQPPGAARYACSWHSVQ